MGMGYLSVRKYTIPRNERLLNTHSDFQELLRW